jgi:membrane fusion protein (multidrug efflux system)
MTPNLFRQAALEQHARNGRDGDILRLDRTWVTWTYRLVLLGALAAVVFIIVFDVNEYASGAAIFRLEGRRPLVSMFAGTVDRVHVQPGQHVTKDQPIVTLSSMAEEAELKRATAEFQLSLAALLRDPADSSAKAQLTTLKPRRDSAAQIARGRVIRAPEDGVVTDVKVRPGQHLTANELVAGVAPVDAPASIVCIMPGEFRPMLKAGQNLRYSVDGYKFEYHTVKVESVGEEIVGPNEVRRYLGQELGDSVNVQGSSVLVKATLPTRTFTSDGQTYSYFEGLSAHADVRVRAEPIIVVLLPALKSFRVHR